MILKKKSGLIWGLAIVIVCIGMNTPILAYEDIQTNLEENQDARYNNIYKISSSLTKSGSNAVISSSVRGQNGVTKTSVTSTLQRKVSGKWVNVTSWTNTQSKILSSLNKTTPITKGYSYRVMTKGTAYRGSVAESSTVYSNIINYN